MPPLQRDTGHLAKSGGACHPILPQVIRRLDAIITVGVDLWPNAISLRIRKPGKLEINQPMLVFYLPCSFPFWFETIVSRV
jgi:hypothetical protein